MHRPPDKSRPRIVTALIETFGFSPLLATLVSLFLAGLAVAAIVWLWLSAPPRTITITSGPPGSTFERYALSYQKFLAEKYRVTVRILPSGGSLDNLERLKKGADGVDVGLVQGGLVGEEPPENLVSLGSVSYQPILMFYRGAARITRLSELAGRRVGVGVPGSGAHALALALLKANEITGAPTTLVEEPAERAAADLLKGQLDAVFLTGDSAPIETLRALLRNPEVQLFNFTQADAYARRIGYLNKIVLPQGSFDFATNLPAQDVALVGPAVEIIARKDLNAALSDLLLEAARFTHGKPGLLAKRDEFPAPLKREFPISEDAQRYYKSGLGVTYKFVHSLWAASLINRVLVAIVPILLLLIPTVRLLPVIYKWSVQLRIYRCYRPLLRLERDAESPLTRERADELLERLDEIEDEVNALKVPASFASQFYALREHVAFVRSRLKSSAAA